MIMDERTEFADATALNTGAPGSYLIGDVVDLSNVRDIGSGQPIYLVVMVATTATSGGSATLTVQLVTDDNASLSSPTVVAQSAVWDVADLTAGTIVWMVPLPHEGVAYERYIGIRQVTGTAAFTAGALNAFLTLDPQSHRVYPAAAN